MGFTPPCSLNQIISSCWFTPVVFGEGSNLREEDPYREFRLFGPYEILFRDASPRLHHGIQLYYCVSRVHRYSTSEADFIFGEIYRDRRFGVLPTENAPHRVELIGPREERLEQLQAAFNERSRPGAVNPLGKEQSSTPLPRHDVG